MNATVCQVLTLAALVTAPMLVGCAADKPPPPVAPPTPAVTITETTRALVPAPAPHPGINLSAEILAACRISFDNVDTAPKFDFDESALRPDDRTLLESVATCMTTGPLEGRSLRMVGRADPRGELEYNLALGASRAGSVESFLIGRGVGSSRIKASSRGKLDATGTDETGWQLDRRVDLALE